MTSRRIAELAAPKLKVFGITTFLVGVNVGKQVRAIIAVSSQKQAASAMEMSLHEFRIYSAVTGNAEEIRIATENPGTVYWQDLNAVGAERHSWVEYKGQRRSVSPGKPLTAFLLALLFALPMRAQTPRASDQVFLQAAGHVVSGSTTFATELQVSNLSADPVGISILFVRQNTPTGMPGPFSPILRFPNRFRLAPHQLGLEVSDAQLVEWGITGAGMLIFSACVEGEECGPQIDHTSNPARPRYTIDNDRYMRPISVMAIVRSKVAAFGLTGLSTFGEAYGAIAWQLAPGARLAAVGMNVVTIGGVRSDAHYTTKLYYANATEFSTTNVQITLFDGAGKSYWTVNRLLTPLENDAEDIAAMFPVLLTNRMNRQPPIEGAYVRVVQVGTVATKDADRYGCADGCGAFLVQGVMIDRITGDGTRLDAVYGRSRQ